MRRSLAPIATALLALACAPAAHATLPATPASRQARLQAFVLAGAPNSLADLELHAGALGVVYPTYFDCAVSSGRLTGADVPAITAFGRSRGLPVMPRFNCQDGATVHRILTEPLLRAQTLARLAAIGRDRRYRGLCLDLENDGAGDRGALNSFVAALGGALHRHHRRLAVVVDGVSEDTPHNSTAFYDDRYLSAVADSVFVLAWGTHWIGSGPGPIAPLSYVSAVARYLTSLPHASRFVLGAAMYGIDWSLEATGEQAKALEYAGVLSELRAIGAAPHRDAASGEMTFAYTDGEGVAHRVYYADARTVLDVLQIARETGLAAGVWRLGSEDQTLWRSTGIAG